MSYNDQNLDFIVLFQSHILKDGLGTLCRSTTMVGHGATYIRI